MVVGNGFGSWLFCVGYGVIDVDVGDCFDVVDDVVDWVVFECFVFFLIEGECVDFFDLVFVVCVYELGLYVGCEMFLFDVVEYDDIMVGVVLSVEE